VTSQNPAFTDMKKCFIGFVSGAADLTCGTGADTAADTTDKTADTTVDNTDDKAADIADNTTAADTAGKDARTLQEDAGAPADDQTGANETDPADTEPTDTEPADTGPTTDDGTVAPAAAAEEQDPALSPVQKAFFDACSQEISDCGDAPACRDCVSAAFNVSFN
jgi:hypothetical protein